MCLPDAHVRTRVCAHVRTTTHTISRAYEMDSRYLGEVDTQPREQHELYEDTHRTLAATPARISTVPKLADLPGGSKVVKRVCAVHSSKRDVRRVLNAISAEAADQEHASALMDALVRDTSYVPHNVRTKLQNLISAGVLGDVVKPASQPFLSRLTRGCFGG